MSPRAESHIGALDGLRFLAALFVAAAHYSERIFYDAKQPNFPVELIISMSGLGMTLFFVLSGFVIHYNYQTLLAQNGGPRIFAIARFSRLYPLYIVLFTIEFVMTVYLSKGSCGLAESRTGLLFALPYYVTLTQDWIYGVICKNSLIYQYGSMSSVSWSISAEIFFYLVYAAWARWLPPKSAHLLISISVAAYMLAFLFVWLCLNSSDLIERTAMKAFGPIATDENGYQDSLLRWLYYFNPLVQFVHFIGGMTAAHLYLSARGRTVSPARLAAGTWLTIGAAAVVLAAHFYLYGVIAYRDGFVGRNASLFYGPLVVVMIYFSAQFHGTLVPKLLSRPLMVKLGEASYSLYLLHALFAGVPKRLGLLEFNRWALWVACLIILLSMSRISYVYFERPAQIFLRNLLSRRTPVAH